MASATSKAEGIYATVEGVVTGTVASAISSLNVTSGSTTTSVLSTLNTVLDYLYTGSNETLLYYDEIAANYDYYGAYLTEKTEALALFFFLPVVLLVSRRVIRRAWQERPTLTHTLWSGRRSSLHC